MLFYPDNIVDVGCIHRVVVDNTMNKYQVVVDNNMNSIVKKIDNYSLFFFH